MSLFIRYQIILYFRKAAQSFRAKLGLIALLLVIAPLVSCNPPSSKKDKHLNISFNTYPTTTDPRLCADFVSSTLVCMVYDGLMRCIPGGEVENALAQSVEISEDLKTYTFHLREAYWSDGKPITADDFEASWKMVLSPAKPCAFLFYPIKNAENCAKNSCSVDEVGIYAIDQKTLKVELEHPTPYFQSLTAFPSFLVAPQHNPKALNGPFLIEPDSKSSEIRLIKNPSYWNLKAVHLDAIHISIVPDEMTALQMFENGELDWLGGPLCPLPPDAIEKLKGDLIFLPNAASTICTFNTEERPFNNVNLRKAFAYAINRQEIVDKITQAGQVPAASILPPSFSKAEFVLTDLELAKRHFEIAIDQLKIDKKELEDLVLYFRPTQIEKRLAQTLQLQWEDAFGITIQLTGLDYKSHAHRMKTRDYQISIASWIAQFDDPLSILDRFKDKSNLKNYPGWEDGYFAHLLNLANTAENREEILAKAEWVLKEQMPLCPIYHWSSPAICSDRIESMGTTPSGGVLFEKFSLNALR